jgi:quercetin dioxygenase-like cupin family protein
MTATAAAVLGVDGTFKVAVEEVKAAKGPAPWGHQIAVNDHYNITVICQDPGHQNDWHYHLTPEVWYIYEGELSWTLEGQQDAPILVKAGDWMIAPANTFHFIQVHGDRPSIRIAITPAGEFHRYEREGKPTAPDGARLGPA